ncbi:MAG: IS1595 family transposase [Cyanobacteria bacterium P01_A01_bin.17]
MPRSQEDYVKILEKLRWEGNIKCPYCNSSNAVRFRQRYHCNGCFTSFSVTVNTFLHNTKIELFKWFAAIYLVNSGPISVRKLASEIRVNKNTADYMLSRIKEAQKNNSKLLSKLSEWTYKNPSFFKE